MNTIRSFKQKLAEVLRLWKRKQYDRALAAVDELRSEWPGNARLHVLWASLVQLQENPTHSLANVKHALREAVDLDKESPAAAIELGHFLDAVEDDPHAASKVFAEATALARRLLIEGLLGQAKALIQLEKREEALRCLVEAISLDDAKSVGKKSTAHDVLPDILLRGPNGGIQGFQLHGPFAPKIEDLLNQIFVNRSA